MHKRFSLLILFLFPLIVQGQDALPEKFIVQFNFTLDFNESNQVKVGALTFNHEKVLSHRLNIHLLTHGSYRNKENLLKSLKNSPLVEAVQFDREIEMRDASLEPNDPLFVDQWNLEKIKAPEVWEDSKGISTIDGDTMVVAIIDNGCDVDHEDIIPNLWINRKEIPGNGLDDDGNNYVDDVSGWDMGNNSATHFPAPHGTGMASIIGSSGNNALGISGVSWGAQLMILDVQINESDVVEAYGYVLEQRTRYNESNGAEGAFVVATNSSFGVDNATAEDYPIWCSMYDALGNAGILNVGATANNGRNVDILGDIPSTCPSEYLIVVANSDQGDRLASSSGLGVRNVDLAAPGTGIPLALPGDLYFQSTGTSEATAMVTGSIPVLYGLLEPSILQSGKQSPEKLARLVRYMILSGVDPIADLKDKVATGGRLNLLKAKEVYEALDFSGNGDYGYTSLRYNPILRQYTLFMNPGFEGDVSWRLFDSAGRLMNRRLFQVSPIDINRVQIDFGDMDRGVYMLEMTHKNYRFTEKLTVY